MKSRNFDFSSIRNHSRELRKNMTESEKILWEELRGRKLAGYKFLRQHPILYKGNLIRYNYFIADFYCHSKNAIIELDGPVHQTTMEYDHFRDSELQYLGINILRIRNDELINIKEVLSRIESFLNKLPDNK